MAHRKDYMMMHFLVVIYGLTPILGKMISLPAVSLVWWRLLFAGISLFVFLFVRKIELRVTYYQLFRLLGVGVIVGAHWMFFYQAIKISNINTALCGFATMALFTAFVEPMIYRRKINALEIILGLITIIGLGIIFFSGDVNFLGLIFGMLAALTASVFVTINGRLAQTISTFCIAQYEFLGAFIFITSLHFVMAEPVIQAITTWRDFSLLLFFSTLCTVFPFVKAAGLAKVLSPYTIILTNNLEPIYGILLAFFNFWKGRNNEPAVLLRGRDYNWMCFALPFFLKKKFGEPMAPTEISPL